MSCFCYGTYGKWRWSDYFEVGKVQRIELKISKNKCVTQHLHLLYCYLIILKNFKIN